MMTRLGFSLSPIIISDIVQSGFNLDFRKWRKLTDENKTLQTIGNFSFRQ